MQKKLIHNIIQNYSYTFISNQPGYILLFKHIDTLLVNKYKR